VNLLLDHYLVRYDMRFENEAGLRLGPLRSSLRTPPSRGANERAAVRYRLALDTVFVGENGCAGSFANAEQLSLLMSVAAVTRFDRPDDH